MNSSFLFSFFHIETLFQFIIYEKSMNSVYPLFAQQLKLSFITNFISVDRSTDQTFTVTFDEDSLGLHVIPQMSDGAPVVAKVRK